MPAPIREAYDRLFAAYGPQGWWPAETPLEVMVGAVLVQNTAWRNVEKAIANLREEGVLSLEALHRLRVEELAELIRSAGTFQVKAKRLKNLIDFVVERYGGDLEAMFSENLASLREELLAIHGIGYETADAILLYAGGLPTFVVDAYTARVFKRHAWIEPEAGYIELKELCESGLDADPVVFNEYHALLVEVGKRHCGRVAKCEGCPLQELLPEGGVAELS